MLALAESRLRGRSRSKLHWREPAIGYDADGSTVIVTFIEIDAAASPRSRPRPLARKKLSTSSLHT
jgi:hypothetical protein